MQPQSKRSRVARIAKCFPGPMAEYAQSRATERPADTETESRRNERFLAVIQPFGFLRRARHGCLTIAVSTAVLGGITAGATGADARTPPFHCKQSPQGQDCTNGGDGSGGSWSPPDFYEYIGWGYERSDGKDATYMDAATVQAALGGSCQVAPIGHGPGGQVPVVCT